MAPEQIRILPVTDDHREYAEAVGEKLKAAGILCSVDGKSEKLGAKIRNARNARVNYFAVVGAQEIEDNTVALQKQDGTKVGSKALDELIAELKTENRQQSTSRIIGECLLLKLWFKPHTAAQRSQR